MEHETGLEGPGGPEDAEHAAAADPAAPESAPGVDDGASRAGGPEPDPARVAAPDAEIEPERAPEPVAATREPRVDAALKLLDRLPNLPVSGHAELYEQVHGQLSDVLGELDSGSAGPAGD
jgi:hypothetical protein